MRIQREDSIDKLEQSGQLRDKLGEGATLKQEWPKLKRGEGPKYEGANYTRRC